MSDDHLRFETLVDRARGEQPPRVQVAAQVASRLATARRAASSDWTLWGATGLSVAAALVMVVLTMQQHALFSDPLTQWLCPLVVVMP